MGVPPGGVGYYGQPAGEYKPTPGTIFVQSVTIPLTHRSGFKLHISVDPTDADRLARTVLPTLRLLHVHHKVVDSVERYGRMYAGDQRGKFITVYPGPSGPAQRVVDTLDPVLTRLRATGVRPGPLPTTRQSRHRADEIRIGGSAMISAYWAESYFE